VVRRYRDGDWPVSFRKTRLKWLGFLKPTSRYTSLTERVRSCRSSTALAIRTAGQELPEGEARRFFEVTAEAEPAHARLAGHLVEPELRVQLPFDERDRALEACVVGRAG
jgi:hypothetical protein